MLGGVALGLAVVRVVRRRRRSPAPRPVVIADPDPEWPTRFERERQMVLDALGSQAAAIEHVGSTAVPGLAAKPIIDMLVGMADPVAAEASLGMLDDIGFTDVSPGDHPGWFYCVGKGERPHDSHLHLCARDGSFWRRHLAFRDYLRAHPTVAAEYCALKRRLAERFKTDRLGYCVAKTGFIRWVEAKAVGVEIGVMTENDIADLAESFRQWPKRRSLFERYWREMAAGGRLVMVARNRGSVAGYATLVWSPDYRPFREQGIPEVVDLNVLAQYRRRGIGAALVWACESASSRRGYTRVGVSVSHSPAHAAANRLYPALGYAPDGRGVTASDNELHLTRELVSPAVRPA